MDIAALRVLQDTDQLRATLTKAIGPRRTRRAIVGLSTDDFTTSAAAGSEVSEEISGGALRGLRIRVGCLMKLFTATLVLDAVAAADIDLDAAVAEYLQPAGGDCANLEGIRIRHLLEHTHGLDDSRLEVRCPSSSGRIELDAICRQLSSTPALAAPGQLYNYSHLGSLLLAAVLEQRFGASYTEMLFERLLKPAGIPLEPDASRPAGSGRSVSPAFDGELSLTAADMMRLVRHCALGSFRRQAGAITALPGWSPIERGIRLGWKAYGDAWYGHASDLREHLTIIKVHPESGTVLLASSADYAPSAVMAAVFAPMLPRSHGLRLPQMLRAPERSELDLGPYTGEYGTAALTVSVDRAGAGPGTLTIRVMQRHRGEASHAEVASSAQPARDHLFVCQGPAGDFAVFQFLDPREAGFQFLWNGKAIFRRTAPSARSDGRPSP